MKPKKIRIALNPEDRFLTEMPTKQLFVNTSYFVKGKIIRELREHNPINVKKEIWIYC